MKIDIQRLRNLTTGRLHTSIIHVYEDLELITGERGLMTHKLPNLSRSIEPWLRANVPDARFWQDEYDVTHIGEFELPEPTVEDRKLMVDLYFELPNPLLGIATIVVTT